MMQKISILDYKTYSQAHGPIITSYDPELEIHEEMSVDCNYGDNFE